MFETMSAAAKRLGLLVVLVASVVAATLLTTGGETAQANPYAETLSAGNAHTCLVAEGGNIACWGVDGNDQTRAPDGDFIQVSAGSFHTCGLTTMRDIECWGNGWESESLDGTFTQVSAGGNHTCGLTRSGTVECWGADWNGQASPPSGTFTQVSAGFSHTCGLRTAGQIECWGSDVMGDQASPPSGTFTQVSAGHFISCGLTTTGEIECWGESGFFLRNPDGTLTEVSIENPDGTFTQVKISWAHACGLTSVGAVECWGADYFGQASPPDGRFTQVSTGQRHSCGLRTDGSVECWGDDGWASPPNFVRWPNATLQSPSDQAALLDGADQYQVATAARLTGPTGGTVESTDAESETGSQVTLLATPDAGYRFVRWEGDADGTENPLTLTPSKHIFVSAIFEPFAETYKLTATSVPAGGDAGYVHIEGGNLVDEGQKRFQHGEKATLVARTNQHYRFLRWEGDVTATENPLELTLTSETSVTAIFDLEDPPPASGEEPVRERRVQLFAKRTLPEETWQIGRSVRLSLPAAVGGSGSYSYSVIFERNHDREWHPDGVKFYPDSLQLVGTPKMDPHSDPALQRFTVFLHADDQVNVGNWDFLELVVNLESESSAGEIPFAGQIHDPCTVNHGSRWVDHLGPSWNDSPEVHQAKRLITSVLFGIPEEKVVSCTNADYNDFGELYDSGWKGYTWGHGGWDVQTLNVAGTATANVPFYSLTDGEVVHVAPEIYARAIAVWYDDGSEGFTVYYLHARHVFVEEGQSVVAGQRLGIQGNSGLRDKEEKPLPATGSEHVHIAVHRKKFESWATHGGLRGAIEAHQTHGSGTLLHWHEQLNFLCRVATDDSPACPDIQALPRSSTPQPGHLPLWPPR